MENEDIQKEIFFKTALFSGLLAILFTTFWNPAYCLPATAAVIACVVAGSYFFFKDDRKQIKLQVITTFCSAVVSFLASLLLPENLSLIVIGIAVVCALVAVRKSQKVPA